MNSKIYKVTKARQFARKRVNFWRQRPTKKCCIINCIKCTSFCLEFIQLGKSRIKSYNSFFILIHQWCTIKIYRRLCGVEIFQAWIIHLFFLAKGTGNIYIIFETTTSIFYYCTIQANRMLHNKMARLIRKDGEMKYFMTSRSKDK